MLFRTPCTEEARSILHLFDWNQYFTYKEIYPGTKTNHFKRYATDVYILLPKYRTPTHRDVKDTSVFFPLTGIL